MFSEDKIGPQAMKFFQMAYHSQLHGDYEQAIYYYKKSLAIEETAEAHTFLGWAYSQTGHLQKAILECKKAIKTDPEFGNPYNDIGSYLLQLKRPVEAIPWLKKAKQSVRYGSPEYAFVNLGRAYEMQGLWPLAIDEYRGALRLNPAYHPSEAALEALLARLN